MQGQESNKHQERDRVRMPVGERQSRLRFILPADERVSGDQAISLSNVVAARTGNRLHPPEG